MKILFMGTPEFAAASLSALLSMSDGICVCGVFCQPDRPNGRGNSITVSPVKALASNYNIPVFQMDSMKDGKAMEIVHSLDPDLIVVVAFGKILPCDIVAYPRLGTINIHGSLLPKYRGSSPIQWAVINGDRETGVTSMYLDERMDAGDIIFKEVLKIGAKDTSGMIFEKLQVLGAELLIKTVRAIEQGTAPRIPQAEEDATYTKMLDKTMSPVDWTLPAETIYHRVYGLQPWPGATVSIDGLTLKIFDVECVPVHTLKPAGTILSADASGIRVVCGDGNVLSILELQAPGKRRMSTGDFLRGHSLTHCAL